MFWKRRRVGVFGGGGFMTHSHYWILESKDNMKIITGGEKMNKELFETLEKFFNDMELSVMEVQGVLESYRVEHEGIYSEGEAEFASEDWECTLFCPYCDKILKESELCGCRIVTPETYTCLFCGNKVPTSRLCACQIYKTDVLPVFIAPEKVKWAKCALASQVTKKNHQNGALKVLAEIHDSYLGYAGRLHLKELVKKHTDLSWEEFKKLTLRG